VIDDHFVFDCVIHVCDMSDENLRDDEPTSGHARAHMTAINAAIRVPENQRYGLAQRWTPEEIHQMVFVDGGVDMAMAQAVPIFDWYKDWFAPVAAQHRMAQLYPDRVIFCGGVDPTFLGLQDALRGIDHQVEELGARSFKFYNGHVNGGWRCDDPELAYPMYERCGEKGVTLLQFHKGIPFGQQNIEPLHPGDLQKAARDFPDLNFLIHHLALPYVDEVFNIASRFPNIHLAASGVFNLSLIAPRTVQTWIGRLLAEVGVEKVVWGSEAPFQGSPRPYLRDLHGLRIPEELCDGFGWPQITESDLRAMLGGNLARLLGIDLDAKRRELAAAR
jgi:hypothetical protein